MIRQALRAAVSDRVDDVVRRFKWRVALLVLELGAPAIVWMYTSVRPRPPSRKRDGR